MLLKPEDSECRDIHQKIIVSKEPRENREHRAVNPNVEGSRPSHRAISQGD